MLRDSHADIASNVINGNADGIEAGENSFVQLGEDSGASIYESVNTTTSPEHGRWHSAAPMAVWPTGGREHSPEPAGQLALTGAVSMI